MLAWTWPVSSTADLAVVFHHSAGANRRPKMAEIDNEVGSRARSHSGTRRRSFHRSERVEWVSLLSELPVDARNEPRIWSNHARGYAECSGPGRSPLTGRRPGRLRGRRRGFAGDPDPGRVGFSARPAYGKCWAGILLG